MAEHKPDDPNLLRMLFDAIPSYVFAVDEDVRIVEFNRAAAELLAADRSAVLKKRGGEVLHCIHASENEKGCGYAEHCKECIIRNAVGDAFHGKHVVRRRAKMELTLGDTRAELYMLISATPIDFKGRKLALLVVEDISQMTELHRMIPICARCKKIRDDADSWTRLEAYFKDHWDADFSHGYCPDCLKAEEGKLGSDDTQA